VAFRDKDIANSVTGPQPSQDSNQEPWGVALESFQRFLLDVREALRLEDRVVLGAPRRRTPAAGIRRPSPLSLSATRAMNNVIVGTIVLFKAQLYRFDMEDERRLTLLEQAVPEHLHKHFANVAEVRYE